MKGRTGIRSSPTSYLHIREAPQSSTGFSPFELLDGRSVRGPLDVLREAWEEDNCENESIISYVLTMREI